MTTRRFTLSLAHRCPMRPSETLKGYKDGQNPILHLTSSVKAAEEVGLPFAFTDGHAEMAISNFLADTERLGKVDRLGHHEGNVLGGHGRRQ
jgi:hypothetical protein